MNAWSIKDLIITAMCISVSKSEFNKTVKCYMFCLLYIFLNDSMLAFLFNIINW